MGEDLSAGIKIAIVLVILAALLASVFSILTISKNMTNQSVDELQSSLYAFQNMRWEDYNLRTISGNQVQVVIRSAIDNNIAVVVNTSRNLDESVLYGTKLRGFEESSSKGYGVLKVSGSTTNQLNETCSTETANKPYYNATTSSFVATATVTNTEGSIDSSKFTYVRNISDTDSKYYINPSLKFYSYIIRDAAGSPIGILFDQVKK